MSYNLVVRLGSATVLFSAVFILALVSFFQLDRPEVRWAVIFWGLILIAKHVDIEGFIRALWPSKAARDGTIVGRVSRLAEPNIVRFYLHPGASCQKNAIVAFTESGTVGDTTPLGIVIGHRMTTEQVESEAMLINSRLREGALDQRQIVSILDKDHQIVKDRLASYAARARLEHLIGFAAARSEISRIYFELVTRPPLEEGHLVAVPLQNGGRELLFQVINGKLTEESTFEGGERTFTIGEAEQLGTWSEERHGFETHSWVVPENAEVFHVTEDTTTAPVTGQRLLEVGKIPNSSFPANVNIHDLVLYHSAILGVTGSGKSFLAFQLIESCAAAGIKIICLDITGDYRRYLRNPILIRNLDEVRAFLDSTEQLGIFEFPDERLRPISSANSIASMALRWCREHRTQAEISEPVPKVLLVLEEAHTLIPEWNSNPEKSMQDTVNKTAQVALQARKYGLGFMVVTQRTANVTKSILNQCNTIFAFQAYDETGFDFMKNYMGHHYVEALPNLKKRQGVIVGKASVSDRPVIVRFHDQTREPADRDPRELPQASNETPAARQGPIVG